MIHAPYLSRLVHSRYVWCLLTMLVFVPIAEAQYQWKPGVTQWDDTTLSWSVPPNYVTESVLPAGGVGWVITPENITVTGTQNVSSLLAIGGTIISGGTLSSLSELGSITNAAGTAGNFYLRSAVSAPANLAVSCYDSRSPIYLDGNTGTVSGALLALRGYTTLRNGSNWSCGQLAMTGTDAQQTLWEVTTGSSLSVGVGGVQMGRNTSVSLSGAGATFTTTGSFLGTNEGTGLFAVGGGTSATVGGTLTVTGGGNQTVRVDREGVLTVGGLARGTGTAALLMAGKLRFTNHVANYTGPLALSLPSQGVAVDPTIDTNGYNVTISGTVSGFGRIMKEGAGILKLTADNTNSPDGSNLTSYYIKGGFLEFSRPSNIGIGSGRIFLDGGGLRWAAGNTTDMGSVIGIRANGGTFDTNGNNVSLSNGSIGGVGYGANKLTKTGAGTLTLLDVPTNRTGETEVTGGLIAFASLSRIGTGPIRLNGGGLRWLSGNTADVTAQLQPLGAGSAVFDTNGNNVTFSAAPVTGAGSMTKTGAGTLTMIGAHPFTGSLLAEGGTLALNGTFANKASLRVGTNSTATLNLTGNFSSLSTPGNAIVGENPAGTGTLNVSGPGIQFTTGTFLEIGSQGTGMMNGSSGALITSGTTTALGVSPGASGTMNLTGSSLVVGTTLFIGHSGTGNITLNNSSAITAGNVVLGVQAGSSGTLVLNQGTALNVGGTDGLAKGSGTASVQLNGATLKVTGSTLTTSVPMTLTNSNGIDTSGVNALLNGAFTGTGGLTKVGGGTLFLNAPNAYSGGTSIYGGQITVPVATSLGSGAISIYGGNLNSTGTFTRDGSVSVTGADASLTTASYIEIGYGGTGTLAVASGAQVSTPGSIAFGVLGGGTLGLAEVSGADSALSCGTTMFIGYLSSGGVTVGTGGSVSVGQMMIASGNASQGFFNLNTGGTLNVGGVNGIAKGDGAATFNFGGGLLKVTGSSLTTSVPMTMAVETSTVDTSGVEATLSGTLSGAGHLAKTGAGTLYLTSANNLTGDTTVWAGTLSATTPTSIGTRNVALNGGTLNLAFTGTATVQTLSFDGAIQLGGTWGSLTSSASNKTSRITGPGILQVLSVVPPVVFNAAANAGFSTTGSSGLINLITATGVSPAGGTFSGPGVTGSNFDPAAAGYGIHTITYTASTSSGTFTISVTGGLTLDEEGRSMAPLNYALQGGITFAKDVINHPSHTIAHLNDGNYGNSFSWIGDSANSFAGINFNRPPQFINRIAFGRDNTGVFTDRSLDFYLVQYTTAQVPDASTTAWTTIGAVDYRNATPGINQPALRHVFSFPPVEATGVRIVTATSGIAIDEIEVYPALHVFATNGITLVQEGGGIAHGNLSSSGTAFAKDVIAVAPHTIANVNNGSFGNASSWIGGSANSFIGINLGGSKTLDHIAFGRDNTQVFTDRNLGRYTLQYTTAASPNASTPDASWTTVGIMDYMSAYGANFFTPSLRHLFRFPAVTATGVRLLVPDNAAIDELELYLAHPQLKLEQPVNTTLTSALSTVAFGGTFPASPITKTFTITNTGIASLNLGVITISGTGAGDFATSTPVAMMIASQSSTTIDVTFTPSVAGFRSATLRIASDDPDTAFFEVSLTGSGLVPTFNSATNSGLAYQHQDAPIDLATITGATPPGGTFSGPGVSGGLFDPTAASYGPNEILYTAQGARAAFTITVLFPAPVLVENGGSFAPNNLAIGKTAFAKDVYPSAPFAIAKVNDGVYGSNHAWIANSPASFVGINLGDTPVTIQYMALGRDNLTGIPPDSGTFTLQYTTTPSPNAATPEASWITIGSLTFDNADRLSFRRRYSFPAVQATGFRIKTAIISDSYIGMDELELYGPSTPLEAWRVQYFGSSANTGTAADSFDADNDGIANLLEYAFGLNPTTASNGLLPSVIYGPGTMGYSFTAIASGITYEAEWSTDLLIWTPITDTGTGNQHAFSISVTAEGRKFMRIKVTSP